MSEGFPQLSAEDVAKMLASRKKPLVLDVRSDIEFSFGHIEGAVNLPIQELQARAPKELKAFLDKPIVCVCEHGERSSISAGVLSWMGFKQVANLYGGMSEWRAKGLPVAKEGE